MSKEIMMTELKNKMQQTFNSITDSGNNAVIRESEVDQFFDEDLHDFMKSKFGWDYSEDDGAKEFYQMYACDVRGDFERELVQWVQENAGSNPRIELNA